MFLTHQNLEYMQNFIQFIPLGLCGETQNQAKTKIFNFYTHPKSIEIAQPSFSKIQVVEPHLKILSLSFRSFPDSIHVYDVENWFQVYLLRGVRK